VENGWDLGQSKVLINKLKDDPDIKMDVFNICSNGQGEFSTGISPYETKRPENFDYSGWMVGLSEEIKKSCKVPTIIVGGICTPM